jgi:hydrogenase maturation protease
MTSAVRVIGVGHPDRGDDAAGLLVARALAGRLPCSVEVYECGGDVLNLIEVWRGADRVVLVDAMLSGLPPGTVHVLEPGSAAAVASLPLSNHGFGLAEAIALGRALDALPRRLVIVAIEGADFEAGVGLSHEVQAAVDQAADMLVEALR